MNKWCVLIAVSLTACSATTARAPARAAVVSSAYAAKMTLDACQAAVDVEPSESKALELAQKCQTALRSAHTAILKAAKAVDSWSSSGSENDYACAIKDSTEALSGAAEALKVAGAKVPDALEDALVVVKPLLNAQCKR